MTARGQLDDHMTERLAAGLGTPVRGVTALGGGDTSDAWRVELADGATVFAKTNPTAPEGLFSTEADGLGRLAATGTVRVPEVLLVSDDPPVPHIVLSWIEPGRPGPGHDVELGRSLAALHRTTSPRFGLDRDTITGRRRQPNAWCDTWAEFYATQRLEPTMRLGIERGVLDEPLVAGLQRLMGRLPELVGPPEPPALIHGDLWAGNALADAQGRPWLIDPAVSFSHREMDLAMMALFGGFGPDVVAAYDEAHPLAAGWAERIPLHQLFPLLVHTLHPSPAGYVAAVRRIVDSTT